MDKADKFELSSQAKEEMFKKVTEWDKEHNDDERRCIFEFAYNQSQSSGEYEVTYWYKKMIKFLDDLEYAKYKNTL